jgi:hypothetical protein
VQIELLNCGDTNTTTTDCSLYNSEWHLTDPTTNSITKSDISRFGMGCYKDASKGIQDKWYITMNDFLPKVNGGYANEQIKRTKKASEVTSVSDEALVMWMLHCYVKTWETEVRTGMEIPEDTDEDDSSSNKKTNKKQGKHHSISELSTFMKIMKEVNDRRREEGGEFKTWEEALQMIAMASCAKVAEAKQGTVKARDKLKQTKQKEKFAKPNC